MDQQKFLLSRLEVIELIKASKPLLTMLLTQMPIYSVLDRVHYQGPDENYISYYIISIVMLIASVLVEYGVSIPRLGY